MTFYEIHMYNIKAKGSILTDEITTPASDGSLHNVFLANTSAIHDLLPVRSL